MVATRSVPHATGHQAGSQTSANQDLLLSVAVVTHNNAHLIGPTLAALLEHLPARARVLLVDNHSSDGTLAILADHAQRDPRVTLVTNPRNLGFGAAHNIALRGLDSRFHVIFNPDVLIDTDVFSPLAAYLDSHADVGMLCPRFLNPDGSLQPLNHRHPTVLDLMLRRFATAPVRRLFRRRMARYEMRDLGYHNPCDVPFVSGAFMFCRTQVLHALGGFDERFFLYFEDADLCRRFQQAGWRTRYWPGVSVVHNWERASHKSLRIALIMLASGWRYFREWGFRAW